jgi:hypothetical protein
MNFISGKEKSISLIYRKRLVNRRAVTGKKKLIYDLPY